jgi:hypothetical protein
MPKLLRRANHFAEGRRAVARIWLAVKPAGWVIAAAGSAASRNRETEVVSEIDQV